MVQESKQDPTPDEKKHPHLVTITVDDKNHEVRKGQWVVSDLKAAVGVDPAKVLAKINPHGIKDLADDEEIGVKDGERFMSHARSGASS
jgi:hypothetical protein